MPAADLAARRIVTNYSDQVRTIRARVDAYVTARWGALDDYRDANIAAWVAQVVPAVAGGQRQIANLTDVYLANLEALVLGGTARPVGVPQSVLDAVRGVPPAEVYARAGTTVYTALAGGKDLTAAVGLGLDRARSIAASDLQLAKTHAARHVLAGDQRVTGYRRVVGGGNPCALCLIASTQRYRSGDLLPIHPGCSCDVEPIYGTRDPGPVLDQASVDAVHQAVAERIGADAVDANARAYSDYRDLVDVQHHGELGPVLTVAGQAFTGPSDL